MGWTTGANMLAGGGEIDARPDWLPALSQFEKYLWPQCSAVSADETGITLEGYGSVPAVELLLPGVQVTAAATLVPALGRARAMARRTVSMSHISTIHGGIEMYKYEHGGAYPQEMVALLQQEYIHPGLLVSPTSQHRPPRLEDGKLVGEIDYVYIKPKDDAPLDAVLLYERPDNYDGQGTNVGFVDGSVRWMSLEELDRRLKKQGAKMQYPPAGWQAPGGAEAPATQPAGGAPAEQF